MTVNSRSTKAEILTAYQELLSEPTTAADVWQWLTVKSQVVARETRALVIDCYKLGAWARQCYDAARTELIRPIFKP